jgi:uncharacterized protein YutE (UPF0331/DUF86 family)
LTSSKLRATVILDRIKWVRDMLASIRRLPLDSFGAFLADPRTIAAAESYLRRGLEALMDLGRHILAKGFAVGAAEYKSIAVELGTVGILDPEEVKTLSRMAGYRNRMVHFYNEVGDEELYQICTKNLEEIENLLARFEQWLREHPEKIDQHL